MLPTTALVVLTALHHAVLSDVTANVAQSPLFGSSELGKPFDDGTSSVTPPVVGMQSLSIAYGPFIFAIQATYLLENGGKFSGDIHGTIDPDLAKNSTTLHFQNEERMQRITGTLEQVYGFITMLKLYTNNNSKGSFKVYGPFGTEGRCDVPFTLSGAVAGLFGRSGKYLNAVGAYINPLAAPLLYNRTKMIGGIFGTVFDDYPALSSGHAEVLNITINSGAYIFGLAVTYRFPNGTLFFVSHGLLNSNNNDVIRFSSGERIVQTDLAIFSLFVNYLAFVSLDSRGVRRILGPFGDVPQSNITTVHGTVYGFYGRVGMDHNITALTGLGFYI